MESMEKMEELHAMECMDNTDNADKTAVVNTSAKKKCADSNEHLYKSCTQRLIMWMHLMMITFMIV